MLRPPTRDELDGFRRIVVRRLGLQFDDTKLEYLADVVRRRLDDSGRDDPRAYLALIDAPEGRDELRTLADVLTVGETYFFRYADHFRAFSEAILPGRIEARAAARQLRLLSAGCASGEEPYSLAILTRERLAAAIDAWDVRIQAVDVSPAAIRKAKRAVYSAWSLRETPPDIRQRCFQGDGREFSPHRAAREMVAFEERNLLHDDPAFWAAGAFDVVFCRNVTMYFAPEAARAVIARIARSLVPGGYLFLGHAETLRGISGDFHLRHTHDTFYYQRRASGEALLQPDLPATATRALLPTGILELDAPWVDAIRLASERIASLAAKSAAPDAPAPASVPAGDLSRAVELLREERFSEAMDNLSALPPETVANADAQLLRAVILTNSGRLRDAEDVCRRVLALDELNAGAHYLMALCREHEDDLPGALGHDQTAIYLDANFAMPHLHWGLVSRRTGDVATARRELGAAAELLSREDPSRVLLFGGGFSREALVTLCHSELRARGGRP